MNQISIDGTLKKLLDGFGMTELELCEAVFYSDKPSLLRFIKQHLIEDSLCRKFNASQSDLIYGFSETAQDILFEKFYIYPEELQYVDSRRLNSPFIEDFVVAFLDNDYVLLAAQTLFTTISPVFFMFKGATHLLRVLH
ncbi:MAG: hypothetical protein NZM05_12600 [Chloroherpetonaceae bacterium]|nr:hypothetical protein [Chloroherpetonaceae bacterium]